MGTSAPVHAKPLTCRTRDRRDDAGSHWTFEDPGPSHDADAPTRRSGGACLVGSENRSRRRLAEYVGGTVGPMTMRTVVSLPLMQRGRGVAKWALQNHSQAIGSITKIVTRLPEVVLTYDDGPDPYHTPKVLKALDEARCTATFFVLAERGRRHPRLLEDALAAGHEVGLHGIDHRLPTSFPTAQIYQRLRDGKAMIEDITARPVRWYRPAYGAQSFRSWRATKSAGLEPVLWSATSSDWRDVPQQVRVENALSGADPGAILLCHDGFADVSDGANDGEPPQMDKYDLARRILAGLREHGLEARSLSDALQDGLPFRRAWFSH